MLPLTTVCSHSANCIYGSVWGVKCVSSFVSANRFVVMEGSVLVGVVRERERGGPVIEGIVTGLIAAYRRTFT